MCFSTVCSLMNSRSSMALSVSPCAGEDVTFTWGEAIQGIVAAMAMRDALGDDRRIQNRAAGCHGADVAGGFVEFGHAVFEEIAQTFGAGERSSTA